jgi:hypothetical protein
MANDPPPPPTPSRARPMLRQDQRSDNEALFLHSMPDAARRKIAFNVVERNCREAFARGEEGLALFLRLRDLVERAQVEEAIREFDGRFAPMLDQELINERLRTR